MKKLEPFEVTVTEEHLDGALNALKEVGWSTSTCLFAQAAKDALKGNIGADVYVSTGASSIALSDDFETGEYLPSSSEEAILIRDLVSRFDLLERENPDPFAIKKIRSALPVKLHMEFNRSI